MKLKIGAKVNSLIIVAILLVGGASLILSVTALREEGRTAIEKYHSAVMNEKKSQIRDLVNSAYTIAQERLSASLDKGKIKKEYGDQVKAAVDQGAIASKGVSGQKQAVWLMGKIRQ